MLTLDDALGLCSAARAGATEKGLAMAFAVVDAAGHLVAVARMDGAGWLCADIAHGKAWTAAAFGTTSGAQKDKMAPMPHFAAAVTTVTHGRFVPQTGAVPVFRGGTLLGAIGASGATGEQDEEVCGAAVTACGLEVVR